MQDRRFYKHLAATGALILCSATAYAAPITFRATGEVDLTPNPDTTGLLDELFGGTPAYLSSYIIEYTFEYPTNDSQLGVLYLGRYENLLSSVRITLAGQTIDLVPLSATREIDQIQITDSEDIGGGQVMDQYLVQFQGVNAAGNRRYGLAVELTDYSTLGTAIVSDALLPVPPDVGNFGDVLRMDLVVQGLMDDLGKTVEVRGVLGDLQVVPAVPLPAAGWLLLSGMGAMAAAARRRRQRS